MGENTKIEWAHHTFNPWRGCQHASVDGASHPGCDHCYAEAMSKRNPKTLGVWGEEGVRVMAAESYWKQPLRWNAAAEQAGERQRVFCASLADVFEDWQGPIVNTKGERLFSYVDVNASAIDGSVGTTMNDLRRRLFELIDATPWLDWLLLTKRPENIRRMWPRFAYQSGDDMKPRRSNVWLLTSVSDQPTYDALSPELLTSRPLAPVLGLSIEPLVGPLKLHSWVMSARMLDWVIVGGESGAHARPMHPQWARDIRDQCAEAGVPFFFKQWGEWLHEDLMQRVPIYNEHGWLTGYNWPVHKGSHFTDDGDFLYRVGKHAAGRLLDGRTHDEFPQTTEDR